jgi:hypothetical protein
MNSSSSSSSISSATAIATEIKHVEIEIISKDLDEKTVLFLSAYSDPMSSAISSNDLIWFVFPRASPFVNCIDLATLFI